MAEIGIDNLQGEAAQAGAGFGIIFILIIWAIVSIPLAIIAGKK